MDATPSHGSRPRVGFIGLGVMGRPMARNLHRAGFALVIHSRSRGPVDELLAEAGGEPSIVAVDSPAQVAVRTSVLITMLPDTPDVATVYFGAGGAATTARRGSLFIDMSTIDPLSTGEFAERLQAGGIRMLDAPVSGGERGAIEARLSIMAGGEGHDFEEARPLLDVLGRAVLIGGHGAGQIAKACNQLVVGATIQAVAEALVLAAKAGVDPVKVREVMLGGFAASRVLEIHGQRMLERAFRPGFRAGLHRKDARIILDSAAELDVPLASFTVVAEALYELVGADRGELDHSALVTLIEDKAGVRVGGLAPSPHAD